MKRKLLPIPFRKTLLAVPAAALMLGAAQAGTTIGLNFQSWYYDSGTTPQTIGFGQGYQTTGFPVTAKAFGVAVPNWVNTDPLACGSAVDTTVALGAISAHLTTKNMWESDIGNLVDPANEWTAGYVSSVAPGNDEVTWSFEDNTGWTNDLSGLSTTFPNGYVIQLIGVTKCTVNSRVVVTDGVTTTTNAFETIYTAGNANFNGPVGLMTLPALTSDTLTFGAVSRDISSAQSCAIGGFIITDQPVISRDPTDTSVNQGATLNLSANSFGLAAGLAYQWRHAGTNIPGANSALLSLPNVTTADAGDYDLVVTNNYGSTTSGVATVTVVSVPSITKDLAGVSGTVYSGANFSAWSIVASGGEPLTYNWLRNGNIPVGGNSPTLVIANATVADSGDYAVTVTNSLGSAPSATNHLTVVASPDLYTTDVAQDSPGSYWPLNETTGTEAMDYSGLSHFGTNNGGLTLGVNGPRPPAYQGFTSGKTAYQFDGATSYIECGAAASLTGTTDFTLEAWINTTATNSGTIIQQRDATASGYNGEYMLTVTADGRVAFVVYGGGYQFNLSSPNSINDGNWHHVAAVRRDGTNGVIYIDGGAVVSASSATIAPLLGSIETYIGADKRDNVNYFNGTISDVAVYPYALSANRIGLHAYNGLLGNSGFSLGAAPGGFIADTKPDGVPHSGLNHNSTWVSSLTDSLAVTRTGVAVFSGNGQIAVPADADFNSPTGTFVFWLKASAPIPGPGSEGAMLMDRRTTSGTVIVLNDAGNIFVQCSGGANSFAAGYVPDDNWHLVAVTYDQSATGNLEIFVDGVSQGAQANTAAWAWPTTQQIEIGRSHDAYWKALNGQMDDFRIYNRVLTQTEIASIQTSGALVDTAALKLRFNFDTATAGTSLTWPVGSLQASPTVGAGSVWTNVTGAASPYPFLPPAPAVPAGGALFYRVGL